jgi:hypothetical protein
MKVTEQIELDYNLKKQDDGKFMTRDTIKDKVAAELFIQIVEELYNNNIFTHWSGLEGDAHIRISLDGLSKENYLIAQENCKNNPNNWRLQRPPYTDNEDIAPNYSFEIYVDYEEGITDVSEVISKMLAEIRKLSFQDVQVAKVEYAKESKLPRVNLDGLYKKSETEVFDVKEQKQKMIPAESFEELSEMFLEGDAPEYFYDEETDTYFRNRELIEKSKEYREYKESPEKRKERAISDISKRLSEKMSDEQKYKVIFDCMVNYFKYDYATLYSTQATNLASEANSKFGKTIRQNREKIKYFIELDDIERAKALIELFQGSKEYSELTYLKQRELGFREKEKQFLEEEKEYQHGNLYMTRYGVCEDFAKEFKDICDKLNLPCEIIRGQILSDGVECGHAWNAVMINGKLKHIDISGAIHCKDGTNPENTIKDFFLKTFDELIAIDNGKGRKISEDSERNIKTFISNSVGFDVGD